jgi:RNA polymerase sigma-70 factor, ECF subfamily
MTDAEINELFAACLPKLKKASRKMLSNQQDSEDALQDGLLLAFRKLHQFEGRSSFSTWLYSIVRNMSKMHYRKQATHQTVPLELERADETSNWPEVELAGSRPSPEELCIQNEQSEILRQAAKEIPAKYHPAIEYFHLEGLGEEETARRLHITQSALKSQLHRSRRMLITRIRKSYLAPGQRSRRFCTGDEMPLRKSA